MSTYFKINLFLVTICPIFNPYWWKLKLLFLWFQFERGNLWIYFVLAKLKLWTVVIFMRINSLSTLILRSRKRFSPNSITHRNLLRLLSINSIIIKNLIPLSKLFRLTNWFLFLRLQHGSFIDIQYFILHLTSLSFMFLQIIIYFLMTVSYLPILFQFLLQYFHLLFESLSILPIFITTSYIDEEILGILECLLDLWLMEMQLSHDLLLSLLDTGELLRS